MQRLWSIRKPAPWALLLVVLVTGCSSTRPSLDVAREAFVAGDLAAAKDTLQSITTNSRRERDAASLDLAMVELADGDTRSAEKRLREMRDRFDALPRIAAVGEATSIITDDNARMYRPAGYEEVMVRAMLSICSLARDGADAESYAMQATMKQTDLATAAADRGLVDVGDLHQPIAIAPYLRGILREATHHDYDDAASAYKLVSAVQPNFAPVQADIARASDGVHSAPQHGVLYVIACVGRGPILQQVEAPTTTTTLRIASTLLANRDDDGKKKVVLPNVASVKVPKVILPPSRVATVGAVIDGTPFGTTQTLTDVATLAANHVSAEMPWTIARAVIRRVTKEASVASAGRNLGLEGNASAIFQFAAGSAWAATEKADTRCWGMLPREIQVLRAELPVGDHQVQLSPLGLQQAPLSAGKTQDVSIVDGRNHYLIVLAPDSMIYVVDSSTQK